MRSDYCVEHGSGMAKSITKGEYARLVARENRATRARWEGIQRKKARETTRRIRTRPPYRTHCEICAQAYWVDTEGTRNPEHCYACHRKKTAEHLAQNETKERFSPRVGNKDLARYYTPALRPSLCELCGKETQLHGHHESYYQDHMALVVWLCPSCHGRAHQIREVAVTVRRMWVEKHRSDALPLERLFRPFSPAEPGGEAD